jgi:hypothetical protein
LPQISAVAITAVAGATVLVLPQQKKFITREFTNL